MSASIEQEDKTIIVKAPGARHEVTLADGQTVADALKGAGVDVEALGLDLLIGTERVDATSVNHSDVQDNDEIVAPPKNAALGS